ncbi:MAG: type II toxin-antitoxin system RelE/ParE family toxin [Firmicutes bacterium]|nr:type II toxin-antitoxin system RelE/ParE family toxin [Bacillota bacterium]
MKFRLHNQAKKFMRSLNTKEKDRLTKAITNLPNGNVKPYQAQSGVFRLRVGDWRILWQYGTEINDSGETETIILISKIDNRGDVYK